MGREGLGWGEGEGEGGTKVGTGEMGSVVRMVQEGEITGQSFGFVSFVQSPDDRSSDTSFSRPRFIQCLPTAESAKTLLHHLILSTPSPTSRVSNLLTLHSLTPLSLSDTTALCRDALAAVDARNVGRRKKEKYVVSKLIGDVRKRSGGRADAKVVGRVLGEVLGGEGKEGG